MSLFPDLYIVGERMNVDDIEELQSIVVAAKLLGWRVLWSNKKTSLTIYRENSLDIIKFDTIYRGFKVVYSSKENPDIKINKYKDLKRALNKFKSLI